MLRPNHRSVKSTHINRPEDPENGPSINGGTRWPPPPSTGIVMQPQAPSTSWPNSSIAFKQPAATTTASSKNWMGAAVEPLCHESAMTTGSAVHDLKTLILSFHPVIAIETVEEDRAEIGRAHV